MENSSRRNFLRGTVLAGAGLPAVITGGGSIFGASSAEADVEDVSAVQVPPDLRRAGVFMMNNNPDPEQENRVITWDRSGGGLLTGARDFSTMGVGTGDQLGGQGGLILVWRYGRPFLVTVSAGSNEIVCFSVGPNGLTRVIAIPSGGYRPISVTANGGRVCVLHADGVVSSFALDTGGGLTPVDTTSIGTGRCPVKVAFVHTSGSILAVTARATNEIYTMCISPDGRIGDPVAFDSCGDSPGGFAVAGPHRNILVVANAGDGEGDSSVSSYTMTPDGIPEVRSDRVLSGQTGAGSVVVRGARSGIPAFVFVSNAGAATGGTISAYFLDPASGIIWLNAGAATEAVSPMGEMALTRDGSRLYAHNGASLEAFRILEGGLPGYIFSHGRRVSKFARGLAAL